MSNETQVNEWIESMDPSGFDYGTLVACLTATLLNSEHAPAFRKHLNHWTKVLTTNGDIIKDIDDAGFNREMELLLVLSHGK